jgi:hypothetical protein
MMKPDEPMAFLDPGLNGTLCMSNVDPLARAVNAVYASCFQNKVILYVAKETGHLAEREYSLDVCLDRTLLMMLKKEEGHRCWILSVCIFPLMWVESMKYISNIVRVCSNVLQRNSNSPGTLPWWR